MYSNTPTTIPAYNAHYHHHSDVGEAFGVLALLALILRDPNPGKTLRDLAAAVGILIGALVGVGILTQLWSISPVLVGLAAAGCFFGQPALYLNEAAASCRYRVAPPRLLPHRTGTGGHPARAGHGARPVGRGRGLLRHPRHGMGARTRWDATFPAQYPAQADRRSCGQLCRCEPHAEHRSELPTNINVPQRREQITARRGRITKLIGQSGTDFVLGPPALSLDT